MKSERPPPSDGAGVLHPTPTMGQMRGTLAGKFRDLGFDQGWAIGNAAEPEFQPRIGGCARRRMARPASVPTRASDRSDPTTARMTPLTGAWRRMCRSLAGFCGLRIFEWRLGGERGLGLCIIGTEPNVEGFGAGPAGDKEHRIVRCAARGGLRDRAGINR